MSKKKKMNGGLLLNDTYESKSIEAAIDFFKTNSTFSILTNSSIACITFKAVLEDGIDSPFIHVRSCIIENPVRTLLFKYFPINTLNDELDLAFVTDQPRSEVYNYIQLAQIWKIEEEYNLQLEIYQKTYNTISSAYEPVCPYPIHCFTDLDKDETITEIIAKLNNTDPKKESNILIITDTLGGAVGTDDDAEILYTTKNGAWFKENGSNARELITKIGCIVMEFMDGYTTLKEYLEDATEENDHKKAKSLAAYELVRLREIGFIHGDLHHGNIMYNPNYKYITNNDDKYKGRALLIDFGQSEINKQALKKEEGEAFNLDTTHVYERNEMNLEFYPPYTFEMIYTRRLNVTLAFRETMIQDLEQMLTKYYALPEEEKTKFVQDKKIQLKLDLITNSKWPTNFVLSNVNDFEKEEFDTPFKDLRDPIFETYSENIQRFTKKRNDIIPKVQTLIEFKKPEPPAELPAETLEPPPAETAETRKPAEPSLESKAKTIFIQLDELTKKLKILLFPTTPSAPSAHGGRRYIHSHKNHKNQTDFTNRLKHRIRTTLRIKRRQTKLGKRGKRSKKGKRGKRKQ